MVGGSPDHSGSDSEDDTSYSSYDSEEYHRQTYEDRRNKRRDKYGSNRDRERERDRERKDKKNRETEKEVCLRFSEFGHCPDVSLLNFLRFSPADEVGYSFRTTARVSMKFDNRKKWNYANSG